MKTFLKYFTLSILISFISMGLNACSSKSSTSASHNDKASGTITINKTQIMLLVGGTFGKGSLHFKGKSRDFRIEGLKLGGVGIHNVSLSGDVYKLYDVKDFAGTYFAAEAGLTIIKGVGGIWMTNGNGVTLHLSSKTEGLALAIGIEGLRIKM